MSFTVRISPKAHEDVAGIYNYIANDSKTAARKQVDLIYNAMDNLSEFPKMGKILDNFIEAKTDYRFIVVNKTYLIFYKIVKEEIHIIRVLKGEQDYLNILGLKD